MTKIETLFLSKQDLMAALSVKSVHTIENMIAKGQIPPPVYAGRLPRWPASVLVDFASGRKPGTTA